jgi:hypothetical protein
LEKFQDAEATENEELEAFAGFGEVERDEAKRAADREENFSGVGGLRNFGEVANGPKNIQNEPGGVGAGHEDQDAFFFDETKHDEGGGDGDDGEEVSQEFPFEKPKAVEKKPEENTENFQNGVGPLRTVC